MKKERTRAFKRKIFTLYGLLLLIIVSITSTVVVSIINNKAEYFVEDSNSSESSSKVISNLPETDSFDVFLYASNFDEATKTDGNVNPGAIEFKLALYNKTTKKTIKNIKATLNVGTDLAYGHDVFSASANSVTISDKDNVQDLISTDYSTLNITNFDQVFPTRLLLFIKIKAPTVKLKLEWDEVGEATGITKSYEKIITYSYNDYFNDDLSQGGLSEYN